MPEQNPKPMTPDQEKLFESPASRVENAKDEDLEKIIDDTMERRVRGEDDPFEDEPVEQEPAEEQEPEPQVAEQAEEGEPAEEAAEELADEPKEPSEGAADYDPMEAMRLRLEEIEAQNKLLETQIGRRTGNEGFLKDQLRQLQSENERLKRGGEPADDTYVAEQQPTAPPPSQGGLNPQAEFLQKQAMEQGANAFVTELSGNGAELSEDDKQLVLRTFDLVKGADSRKAQDWHGIYQSGDPEYTRQASRDLLVQTFWSLRRDAVAKKRQEYEQAQSSINKKRKLAAAVTQSTVQAPPARRVKKRAQDMSMKELIANIPE